MGSKINLFFLIFVSRHTNLLALGPECISTSQLIDSIKIVCKSKDNATLWQQVIDCHQPISNEFLRSSGEALCPTPKFVENPMDIKNTMHNVFLNSCGLVEGHLWNKIMGGVCLAFGSKNTMSFSKEQSTVREKWGKDVPCNIGKCILNMGLGV